MEEVSGPVVSIALILASVFIPVGFMSGIQGRLNKQFAITIAISVMISAFNALTLSPALAAMLLRPRKPSRAGCSGAFSALFNRGFDEGDAWLCRREPRRWCARRSVGMALLAGVYRGGRRCSAAGCRRLRARRRLRLLPGQRAAAAGGVARADRCGVPQDRCSCWRSTEGVDNFNADRRLHLAVAGHRQQLRLLLRRPEAVGRASPAPTSTRGRS